MTYVKPRVEAERWVKRGGDTQRRYITCSFSWNDWKWHVDLHMPNASVAAHAEDADFHVAMDKAVRIALKSERRQKRRSKKSAANRRTSRRGRRTSRRAA